MPSSVRVILKKTKYTESNEGITDIQLEVISDFPDEVRIMQASETGEQAWIARKDVPQLVAALQSWANEPAAKCPVAVAVEGL